MILIASSHHCLVSHTLTRSAEAAAPGPTSLVGRGSKAEGDNSIGRLQRGFLPLEIAGYLSSAWWVSPCQSKAAVSFASRSDVSVVVLVVSRTQQLDLCSV